MLKRPVKYIAIISVVLVVVFLIQYLSRPKPISITTATVARGTVESTVTNTRAGTVEACRRARLAPHVGGQISKLAVQEGDKVHFDDVLVELWNKDVKAQLLLARNQANATKAKADEACVRYDVANREANRLTRLHAQSLASEEQAESAQGNAKATKAACKAARDQQTVAQAQIDVAKAAVDRTIIRAPFDGVVAEVNGELGEIVTPSPVGIPTLPVIDLIDFGCIYVLAPIDEVDAPSVKVGLPARITLDAFPNHPFDAKVHRIAPYVQDKEKQARTVDVEVYFARTIGEQNLMPGYSADAEIILARRDNVLRVPTETLFENNHVYVYHDDGTVEKRQIETGIGNWSFTEVTGGLKEGDRIVTSIGIEGLADGVQVRLSNDTGP